MNIGGDVRFLGEVSAATTAAVDEAPSPVDAAEQRIRS